MMLGNSAQQSSATTASSLVGTIGVTGGKTVIKAAANPIP